jgi:hypothetical protein
MKMNTDKPEKRKTYMAYLILSRSRQKGIYHNPKLAITWQRACCDMLPLMMAMPCGIESYIDVWSESSWAQNKITVVGSSANNEPSNIEPCITPLVTDLAKVIKVKRPKDINERENWFYTIKRSRL